MKREEAVKIANMYNETMASYRKSRKQGNKESSQYYLGLSSMALQIFEMFNNSHGFGSIEGAIKYSKTSK